MSAVHWVLGFLAFCFILYVVTPWAVRLYVDAQVGRKRRGNR